MVLSNPQMRLHLLLAGTSKSWNFTSLQLGRQGFRIGFLFTLGHGLTLDIAVWPHLSLFIPPPPPRRPPPRASGRFRHRHPPPPSRHRHPPPPPSIVTVVLILLIIIVIFILILRIILIIVPSLP